MSAISSIFKTTAHPPGDSSTRIPVQTLGQENFLKLLISVRPKPMTPPEVVEMEGGSA